MNSRINEALSSLKSVITVGDYLELVNKRRPVFVRRFGGDKDAMILTREDYRSYRTAMNTIFNEIAKKEPLISYQFFEDSFFELLLSGSENLFNDLINKFSKIEKRECRFIKPLYGVEMIEEKTISSTACTFISKSHIHEHMKAHCLDERVVEDAFQHIGMRHYCFEEITVSAKDITKAREGADALYKKLDNALRYMMGDNRRDMGLGVFNYPANIRGEAICFASDGSILLPRINNVQITRHKQ